MSPLLYLKHLAVIYVGADKFSILGHLGQREESVKIGKMSSHFVQLATEGDK